MGKQANEAAPTNVAVGKTPPAIAANLRVVDAKTGEVILKVIAADSVAGTVRRHQVDEKGNVVREDNKFVVVDEKRACAIEWIAPPAAAAPVAPLQPDAGQASEIAG